MVGRICVSITRRYNSQGTIVGANSIILHSLPPFVIAVGTPAKPIKKFNFENKNGKNIKNILVTGGAGFIGSNLVLKLLSNRGYYITVLDNLSPQIHGKNPGNRILFV